MGLAWDTLSQLMESEKSQHLADAASPAGSTSTACREGPHSHYMVVDYLGHFPRSGDGQHPNTHQRSSETRPPTRQDDTDPEDNLPQAQSLLDGLILWKKKHFP